MTAEPTPARHGRWDALSIGPLPLAAIVAASLATFISVQLPGPLWHAPAAVAAGLAAARLWGEKQAWVASLVVALGPPAFLLGPVELALAATLVVPVWAPRAGPYLGVAAGILWPPAAVAVAAWSPVAAILAAVVAPVATLALHGGSLLLAAALLGLTLTVGVLGIGLDAMPRTQESMQGASGVLAASLVALPFAAALLARPVVEGLGGITDRRAVAMGVGLLAVLLAVAWCLHAMAVLHRTGDPAGQLGITLAPIALILPVALTPLSSTFPPRPILGAALLLAALCAPLMTRRLVAREPPVQAAVMAAFAALLWSLAARGLPGAPWP